MKRNGFAIIAVAFICLLASGPFSLADSAAKPSSTLSPSSKPAVAPQVGSFTREDGAVLFNRYRKTLADGDFNGFAACIYVPPDGAGAGPPIEGVTPEEFTRLKKFLLEMTPDLANAEMLRFYSNEEAALLVIRYDLANKEYITLSGLKFISKESGWKVFPKFYDSTFPRQDPQADQAAIARELDSDPGLQLSVVTTEARAATSPPGDIPAQAGKAEGELIINGTAHALKYAYAYTKPSLADEQQLNTVVILSNIPLDDEAVDNWGLRAELEDSGRLHCVELTINADGRVVSRRLRDSAFEASPSGVSSDESFLPQAAGRGTIAGKAFTAREDDFFGVTFQYHAAFRAEIKQPVKEDAGREAVSQQSDIFMDIPEHQAVVKMLKAEGKTEIMKTAHSVSINSSVENFARVGIGYEKEGRSAKEELYLFREGGDWMAYSRLPTHKDSPEVFSELARHYCKSRYKNMMGGSNFMDDGYQSKEPQKRIINVKCGELIDKQWQYHRLSMVFEYDTEKGWGITGAEPYRKPESQAEKTVSKKSKTSKTSAEKKPPASLQEAMAMSDLQIAIMLSGNQGEARALEMINNGADLSFKNKIGDTPLHTAVNTRPPSINIVQALLEASAAVDVPNEYGYTPLHNLAGDAVDADAPTTAMLIGAGADVNRRDPYGMTPLYHMTIRGRGCKGLKVAQAIIDAGADVNSKADDGTSVLAAAKKNNCDGLAALLVDAGAH